VKKATQLMTGKIHIAKTITFRGQSFLAPACNKSMTNLHYGLYQTGKEQEVTCKKCLALMKSWE